MAAEASLVTAALITVARGTVVVAFVGSAGCAKVDGAVLVDAGDSSVDCLVGEDACVAGADEDRLPLVAGDWETVFAEPAGAVLLTDVDA